MRKFIRSVVYIALSGVFLLYFSCAQQSCFEATESFVKTTLYSNKTGKLQAPDSLTLYGMNMETNKLYNKSLKVTTALLPLNASESHCTFIVKINGVTDSIEFRYTSHPHLVSKECGYTFYYNLTSDSLAYTKHIIDTVFIRNNNITTLNEENVRIFYKSIAN